MSLQSTSYYSVPFGYSLVALNSDYFGNVILKKLIKIHRQEEDDYFTEILSLDLATGTRNCFSLENIIFPLALQSKRSLLCKKVEDKTEVIFQIDLKYN